MRSHGIHIGAISLDDVKIPINKTRLNIAVLKWHPGLPGANELKQITCSYLFCSNIVWLNFHILLWTLFDFVLFEIGMTLEVSFRRNKTIYVFPRQTHLPAIFHGVGHVLWLRLVSPGECADIWGGSHQTSTGLQKVSEFPAGLHLILIIPPTSTNLKGRYTCFMSSVRLSVCLSVPPFVHPSVDKTVSGLYLPQY